MEVQQCPFALSSKFTAKHLHLGITGSVAAYKSCELLRLLLRAGLHVSATLSAGAKRFITPLLMKALGASPVYDEMFDESGEAFSHLEPGHLGGGYVIAPASANFLAQAASGFASDILACQLLAFSGPVAFAPAMNPAMWSNPSVRENVQKLISRGWKLIKPACGATACGDQGAGRLAALNEIFTVSLSLLAPQDMSGINVLVTMGPTREYWDCARFWSNPSSGRMGAALATAAWLRGACVTCVAGPCENLFLPSEIRRVDVESASEMFMAANDFWDRMDLGMFCAAVADFRPAEIKRDIKIKKATLPENLQISFERNPDILGAIGQKKKSGQKILGFAAEAASDNNELRNLAKLKLKMKNADLLAVNNISGADSAFGKTESALLVTDKFGHAADWLNQPKADSAWELCSWLLRI